jgi:hypothetical protein
VDYLDLLPPTQLRTKAQDHSEFHRILQKHPDYMEMYRRLNELAKNHNFNLDFIRTAPVLDPQLQLAPRFIGDKLVSVDLVNESSVNLTGGKMRKLTMVDIGSYVSPRMYFAHDPLIDQTGGNHDKQDSDQQGDREDLPKDEDSPG